MTRTLSLVALAAAGLALACGQEPTAPTPSGVTASVAADSAFGGVGPAGFGMLARLPANLALTTAQKTQIKAYTTTFHTANKSDLDAMRSVMLQARAARRNGGTAEQVRAILQQSAPIRQRLQPARTQLRQQIESVLTANQKAWLAANTPRRCDPVTAPRLSDAQKAQLKSLRDAFAQANKTDLDAVRAAFQQAHQARQNGSTPEQVKAILQPVQPAMQRLATARQQLRSQVRTVLTPEQQASGCFVGRSGFGPGLHRGGMGPGMMQPGFRRGGAGPAGA